SLSETNTFTIIATNAYGVSTTNTSLSVLPSSISLLWDANGNLTNDGLRTFVYDSENRLTNVYVPNAWSTEFVYDGLGRRRIIREYAWTGTWTKTNETRFVFDGMLSIQERGSNNASLVTYARGPGLGGSLAIGIGGLL